jgi:hypothetical protein
VTLPVPGYDVVIADVPPSRATPTDTGTAFLVAESERGAASWAGPYTNLDALVAGQGDRMSYSYLYDTAEALFREGVGSIFVSRVVSPTITTAAGPGLNDAGAVLSLTVQAKTPGTWGNSLTRQVIAGPTSGTYVIIIRRNGVEVDRSGALTTQQDAIAWSHASKWVNVVLGPSANPPAVAAEAAFTGGNDNRGAITDADWQLALDKFTADLGPGQVAAPGRTTDAAHAQIRTHAFTHNRHATLDLPDSSVSAAIASVRAADAGLEGRNASAYWPWLLSPPLPGSATPRIVPPCVLAMAACARADQAGNPNLPPAGEENDRGVGKYVIGTTQDTTALSATDLQSLQDNGINVIRTFYGVSAPVQYGNRTIRLESADPLWLQTSGSRCVMAYAAQGGAIVRRYVHSQVDGKKWTLSRLQGELVAEARRFFEVGAIYGDDVGDAANIDALSDAVNPASEVQKGNIKATAAIRVSPGADHVTFRLVRVPITQEVA